MTCSTIQQLQQGPTTPPQGQNSIHAQRYTAQAWEVAWDLAHAADVMPAALSLLPCCPAHRRCVPWAAWSTVARAPQTMTAAMVLGS
jgi:hypothetical protein